MQLKNLFYSFMVHTSKLYGDTFYIRHQFKHHIHRFPDLKHPKTFQEKLQWLKLYDRKPIYSQMVDKYEAKPFIQEKVGVEYVIPTIGIFDNPNEIDYKVLPETFVVKTTHDSGTVVVCNDKSLLDITKTNLKLSKSLKKNYYYSEREWPYKNVKPRIIVEENINKGGGDLSDYKFYCFNGEPKILYITTNRGKEGGLREDYFDIEGKHLIVTQKGYPNNEITPSLPQGFAKMQELAKILSAGIPHLRVDFYEVDGKIYIGELTFSDGGGYALFDPDEYNNILGDWIKLPIDE